MDEDYREYILGRIYGPDTWYTLTKNRPVRFGIINSNHEVLFSRRFMDKLGWPDVGELSFTIHGESNSRCADIVCVRLAK